LVRIPTEREHGKTVYEAEMIVDGHSKDIQIAEDGTLNEVEEEVAFSSLSANVQAALKAKAGEAKITKVESLAKQNKLVAYEAATLKGTKRGEIQVGPDGGKLSQQDSGDLVGAADNLGHRLSAATPRRQAAIASASS